MVGEWFCYNFAAGSFHTKDLCSRFYSIYIVVIHKKEKFTFWFTLWGLWGNVRTSSTARLKARGRLPVRDNWTSFASSYGWDVISRYWSKSALSRRGWVTLRANFRWKGTSPSTIVGIRKLERFCYLTVKTAWPYLHSSGRVPACHRQRTNRWNCRG